MNRVKFWAAGIAAIACIVAVFTIMGPGGPTMAWADMRQALAGVRTMHVVGSNLEEVHGTIVPLAEHRDMWTRREPYTVHEQVTPGEALPSEGVYIYDANAERTWFYFPRRGNRATMNTGRPASASESSAMDPFGQRAKSDEEEEDPRFKIRGHSRINGRKVILLEQEFGPFVSYHDGVPSPVKTELAVDAETKLTLRLRQYTKGPGGKQVEVTRLDFQYNQTPPPGIFDWKPPTGAKIVDRRNRY